MLKFLAREKSNVDKIEKLRRKAADTEGSLRCIQLARATLQTREYVVETIPATGEKLKSMFARIDVQEVVNKLVHDVEEKFACDKAAKDTLDRIIKQLEVMDPNSFRNSVKKRNGSKPATMKFLGRQKKPTLSWAEKANVVYFHLHPNFAGGCMDLTCAMFDLKESTVLDG